MRAGKTVEATSVVLGSLALLALIVTIGYGGWKLQRWYHYKFGYESQVSDTVRELVKPECLK